MKKQTRFQTTSLLIALLLTSGLMIQSQLFSQSALSEKTSEAIKVSVEKSFKNDFKPTNSPEDQLRRLDAGKDATTCVGDASYALSGISNYAGPTYWTSSGDGQFSDPSSLNSIYQPGDYDTSSGQVTLFLHTSFTGPSDTQTMDAMVLSFVSCTLPNSEDDDY